MLSEFISINDPTTAFTRDTVIPGQATKVTPPVTLKGLASGKALVLLGAVSLFCYVNYATNQASSRVTGILTIARNDNPLWSQQQEAPVFPFALGGGFEGVLFFSDNLQRGISVRQADTVTVNLWIITDCGILSPVAVQYGACGGNGKTSGPSGIGYDLTL